MDLSTDPAAGVPFKPFGTLTGTEVNVLPPEMQFNVPTIGCENQLDKRPAGAIDAIDQQVVACESGAKMYLDVAKVDRHRHRRPPPRSSTSSRASGSSPSTSPARARRSGPR